MIEHCIDFILNVNPVWIYSLAFVIAYIENIFPPFPSDVIIVAAGYLCSMGQVNFFIVLGLATFGSALGFISMYKIAFWFDGKVIEKNKLKFIPLEKIHIVEKWFKKYGYIIIVLNRFLAGTRAVIAFFAGISRLSFVKTTVLATISSLVWNIILLYAGMQLGENWRAIETYLDAYGKIITIITVSALAIYLIYIFFKKKKKTENI